MCKKLVALLLAMLMLLSAAYAEADVVPFGEKCTFETQVRADGTARTAAGDEEYETLRFDIRVVDNRGPVHFKKFYADDFMLKGNEAVAELELTLQAYEGTALINPNNIFLLTLQAEDGSEARGYRMLSWEMGGSGNIELKPGLTISVFKRYDFDEDAEVNMRYLVLHAFVDGAEQRYLLDMHNPDGENTFTIVYEELKRKSRGKAVTALQTRLKELDLLSGTGVDGVYGPKTAESVKAAQALLGFEETGVATHEFQKALYKYVPAEEAQGGE